MSVIFDLETQGMSREEILAAVPPFDRDNVKLGNRKDPESIMRFMESAEDDYYDRLVERAALDARTGAVLVIGLGEKFGLLDGPESHVIKEFWRLVRGDGKAQTKFIGFNILKFDLPFLVRRSWKLGILVPPDLFDGRFFHKCFVDLMSYWICGNRDEMISLDHLARFFDLPPKKGSGAGFAALWRENRKEAIEYLKHDLELTSSIAKRMNLL